MLFFIFVIALFIILMPVMIWLLKAYLKLMMVVIVLAIAYWSCVAGLAISHTSHSINVHQAKMDNTMKDTGIVVHKETAQECADRFNKSIEAKARFLSQRMKSNHMTEEHAMHMYNATVINHLNKFIEMYGEENAYMIKYEQFLD